MEIRMARLLRFKKERHHTRCLGRAGHPIVNSHAVPRLGAGKTTSFVVAAQMLASLAIDGFSRPFSEAIIATLGGAAIIVAGVWMAAFVSKK